MPKSPEPYIGPPNGVEVFVKHMFSDRELAAQLTINKEQGIGDSAATHEKKLAPKMDCTTIMICMNI